MMKVLRAEAKRAKTKYAVEQERKKQRDKLFKLQPQFQEAKRAKLHMKEMRDQADLAAKLEYERRREKFEASKAELAKIQEFEDNKRSELGYHDD